MKGGAWQNRRSYVDLWINTIHRYTSMSDTLAKMSGKDETYHDAQKELSEMDEYMEKENLTVPGVPELLGAVENLDVKEEDELQPSDIHEEDTTELEELIEDQKTPTLGQGVFSSPSDERKGKKPVLELVSEKDEENIDYAESFASQREAAQLREELEAVTQKMQSLEELVKGLLKEREAIPSHLDNIKSDVNRQLTLMLDKLQGITESDLPRSSVTAATTTLEAVKEEANDQLQAASSYASAPPKVTSPLATPGANLRGKRRFKPIK
jgi:chromosome segregation ATPase